MSDEDVDVRAIGVVVGLRRRVFGWSQHELAKRARVSASHLRRLEAGESSTLGVGVLVRLAGALEMTPDELLRYSGVRTGTQVMADFGDQYGRLSLASRETLLRVAELLADLEDVWAGNSGATTPEADA